MNNELRLELVKVVYDHAKYIIEKRAIVGERFNDARFNRAVERYHNILFTVLAEHGYDCRNTEKRNKYVTFCDRCFYELIQGE